MKTIEKDSKETKKVNEIVGETSGVARRAGLRRISPRHRTRRGEVSLRNVKVRITMLVDADVLEHFKARAAQASNEPFQAQMNRALREAMERETAGAPKEE